MAITVTNNNTRGDSYDGTYGGSNIGSGSGGNTADDSYYQGTNAWGRKINSANNDRGLWTTITSIDTTAAGNEVLLSKTLILNNPALNTAGLRIWIGSSTGNYSSFVVADDTSRGDVSYPAKGGWVIRPVNPNVGVWVDSTTGTPTNTAITNIGVVGNVSSVSKDLNIFIDASDFSEGLFLVGTSPDGSWQDFIDHDENTSSNRFGHVTTIEGIIYLFGKFVVGRNNASTVTLTTFTDSNKTLVFPGGSVDVGWNKLEYDLGNSSTVVSLSSIVHSGTGRDDRQEIFDANSSVSGVNDTITINNHGFSDLDGVNYDANGGLAIGGLTDGNDYVVGNVATNTVQLFLDRSAALAGTSPINLTNIVGNSQQFLRRTPSTLPDLTITGTSGSFTADRCNFNRFRNFINTSAATWTNCTFTNFKSIDCLGATFTSCTFEQALSFSGESELIASADEAESLSGCVFNANNDKKLSGHAVEIDSAPTGGNLDFNNLTFNNYGEGVRTFNASTDVNFDTLDVAAHNYSVGDPVFYLANDPSDGSAGTVLSNNGFGIQIANNGLYYIGVVNANEISLHITYDNAVADANRANYVAGSNEVHALYDGNAAVHNSTSTDIVINVTNGGSSPSYRNSSTGTVTVNNSVPVSISNISEGTSVQVIANETAGTITTGDVLAFGLADSSGEFSFSLNYEGAFGAGLDVIVRCRNQGFPNAGIADDGGVFTDETTANNSAVTNDITLMPSSVSLNDAYYWGHSEKFNQLKLDISQAGGVGVATLTWEYWNGSSWASLPNIVDGTNNYENSGINIVSWTDPAGWATTSVNSQGPYYYVRARQNTGITIAGDQPLGRKVKLDVTRYLPFTQNNTVTSNGLSVVAVWIEDTISTF